MAQGEPDFFDVLWFPGFVLGMMGNLGIAGVGQAEIPVLGITLSEPLFTLGESTTFTIGFLIALIAWGATLATNDWGLFGVGGIHMWAVVVNTIFVFSPPMIPIIGEVLLGPEITSVIALIIVSFGYLVVSWLG